MTDARIWIERRGETFAVLWHSGGLKRCQTCENEDQARSFVAGLEEGLDEAARLLADFKPRFRDSSIQAPTG